MPDKPWEDTSRLEENKPAPLRTAAETVHAAVNFEKITVQSYNWNHINVGSGFPAFLRSDIPCEIQVQTTDKSALLEIRDLIWEEIYTEDDEVIIFKTSEIGIKMTESLRGLLRNLWVSVKEWRAIYTLTW